MVDLTANVAGRMEVFTDGCCSRNPGGDGGWAFVAVQDGCMVAEFCGSDPETTSNRAELKAIIQALLWLPPDASAVIVSDSKLCVEILSGNWHAKSNLDLVEEARALIRERRIGFQWVRAHAGQKWNERADALAAQGQAKANQKKRKRPRGNRSETPALADLRKRAELDGIPFDDTLPDHLIP